MKTQKETKLLFLRGVIIGILCFAPAIALLVYVNPSLTEEIRQIRLADTSRWTILFFSIVIPVIYRIGFGFDAAADPHDKLFFTEKEHDIGMTVGTAVGAGWFLSFYPQLLWLSVNMVNFLSICSIVLFALLIITSWILSGERTIRLEEEARKEREKAAAKAEQLKREQKAQNQKAIERYLQQKQDPRNYSYFELLQYAIYEAGKTVAIHALFIDAPFPVKPYIEKDPRDIKPLGKTDYFCHGSWTEQLPKTEQAELKDIRFRLAGAAAEEAVLGQRFYVGWDDPIGSTSNYDLVEASNMMRKMCKINGISSRFGPAVFASADNEENKVDPWSDWILYELEKACINRLKEEFLLMKEFMARNKKAVWDLAEEIIIHEELSEDQLEEFFAEQQIYPLEAIALTEEITNATQPLNKDDQNSGAKSSRAMLSDGLRS